MYVGGGRETRVCRQDNHIPRSVEEYRMIMFQEDYERGPMMARRKERQYHGRKGKNHSYREQKQSIRHGHMALVTYPPRESKYKIST